jgi:hypothetical protein
MNPPSSNSAELEIALDAFLQTASMEEAYQVIQQHPILLTDSADILFSSIIQTARQQGYEETVMALDERRDFIRSVRQELDPTNI